ncbi:phosphatidic acid phosphatase type 2/haloperoxidase [Kalaharituber pfeilii]|nr:phosphatidic acid phosphatase type 2/haloperoxidase [Kalaharituber pfeilii]
MSVSAAWFPETSFDLERAAIEVKEQTMVLINNGHEQSPRYSSVDTIWKRLVCKLDAARLPDWIAVIAIYAFSTTMGHWLFPTTRPFPLPAYLFPSNDTSTVNAHAESPGAPIAMPYLSKKSTVPTGVLMVLCLAAPFLLILFSILFAIGVPATSSSGNAAKYRPRLRLANLYLLGLMLSIALTLLATDTLKNIVGKQRPDFWGRCGGVIQDPEVIERYTIRDYGMSSGGVRMVTWEVCQNYYNTGENGAKGGISRDTLQDGWRSFPSGHASLSFAGLGYLSLFFAYAAFGILGTKRQLGHQRRPIIALLITITPTLLAGYIAASRYGDLMHAGIDICAGVVIGVLGAVVGWGWYWREVRIVGWKGERIGRGLTVEMGKGQVMERPITVVVQEEGEVDGDEISTVPARQE